MCSAESSKIAFDGEKKTGKIRDSHPLEPVNVHVLKSFICLFIKNCLFTASLTVATFR